MKPFLIEALKRNSIGAVSRLRAQVNMSPDYQRQSGIWDIGKRQLFIDSILNGFDVPKFYFHEVNSGGYKYAVVDGKQRLEAIWGFIEGAFALSDDFQLFERPDDNYSALKYEQLPPPLQAVFDEYELPIQIISIGDGDTQWVEELFSRLNEAVALNAPERRNALGGPLPSVIRTLSTHRFFLSNVPFKNSRYKYYDLATKFLFLEQCDGPDATKRRSLDDFVKDFKENSRTARAEHLRVAVAGVLDRLATVFGDTDVLLSSLGLVVIYYLMEREMRLSRVSDCRERLAEFDGLRRQVRELMRVETTGAPNRRLDSDLVEFERLSQSPNDVAAMKKRMATLTKFINKPSLIKTKLREIKGT